MILKIEHIKVSFNGILVLNDASFSIPKGTITSLFGENGSGKTTLFHVIAGFLKPASGDVVFRGVNLHGKSAAEIDELGIGRAWQAPRVFRNMSVLDNLVLASKNHPGEYLTNYLIKPRQILVEERNRKERALEVCDEIGLSGKLQKTAGTLSFGQQKLLSVGMLLMNNAELLLLDEPFAGVNGQMIDVISNVFVNLKQSGRTILLVEHNRKKASQISDKIIHLEKGYIREELLT